MKGIILAGGEGTRLRPMTQITNKHLLPIYDRPMIEYPISTLVSMGIHDILIVSGREHSGHFVNYLGSGEDRGLHLQYSVQEKAGGIAHALNLAKDFVAGESVMTILGDNIFGDLKESFLNNQFEEEHPLHKNQATLIVKEVSSGASRFGVLTGEGFAGDNAYQIVEKPKDVGSGKVVTGLYVYPASVFDVIATLKPSGRGELEITDVNNHYIKKGDVRIYTLPDDVFWSDAGTPDSMNDASNWARQKYGK